MEPQLDQSLQTHLPVRADLPEDLTRGFLNEVALGEHRVESALVFADWLDDQGDARGQAVRWSAWKDSHGRESAVRRTLAGRLHAWMTHYRQALVGTDQPGGTLEWHEGLLRLRTDAGLLTHRDRRAFVPAVWGLIEAGWLGEIAFRGVGAERFLAGVVRGLRDVPRIGLEGLDESAIERLEELPSLRELTLRRQWRLQPAALQSLRAHPYLEVLTFHGGAIDQVSLFDLPQLRRLRIQNCTNLSILQLRHLPALEAVHLGGTTAIPHLNLANLPELRRATLAGGGPAEIDFRGLPALEELTLHNLTTRRVTLRNLPVVRCVNFRGASVSTFEARNLEALTHLDLGKHASVSQVDLRDLPALESLMIRNARRLGRLDLVGVPALRRLHVPGCIRLPETWFADVKKRLPDCVVERTEPAG